VERKAPILGADSEQPIIGLMKLTEEAIKDFKRIYLEEFGEALSEEEAQERAHRFLTLFRLIYRELPLGHRCSSCLRDKPKI